MRRRPFPNSRRPAASSRRGAVLYGAVLATALAVSLLSLSGLLLARVEHRASAASRQLLTARVNAQSAVQYALRRINSDPSWRSAHTNGQETVPQPLAANVEGTISWVLEDIDGSLTDSDTDLRLKGVGRVGTAVQVSSVRISGTPQVLDSLLCSAYAVGDVVQTSNSITTSGPFASGGTFTVNGDVIGDVEGSPVVVIGSVSGAVSDPGPDRTMPPAEVWDLYTAMATPLPYSSFPMADTNPNVRLISRELLSGSVNPYGPVNPDGIYHVQVPNGATLTAVKSRFHCTLLVELVGSARFATSQSCLWDPYNGNNFPAAIIKCTGAGVFELKSSNATLKESQQPKFNFNPPGDPYDGVSNTLENDNYQPLMRGLFHVIGSGSRTTLASNLELEGVVVTEGELTLGANLHVILDPTLYYDPPLGYTAVTGNIQPVDGSWTPAPAP